MWGQLTGLVIFKVQKNIVIPTITSQVSGLKSFCWIVSKNSKRRSVYVGLNIHLYLPLYRLTSSRLSVAFENIISLIGRKMFFKKLSNVIVLASILWDINIALHVYC